MAKSLTLRYTPGKRGSDGRIQGVLVDCAGTERVCIDRAATEAAIDYVRTYCGIARDMHIAVDDRALGKLTKARVK